MQGRPRFKFGTVSLLWVINYLSSQVVEDQHLKATCYRNHKIYTCYIHWKEQESLAFPCSWRYIECYKERSPRQATSRSTHIFASPTETQRHHDVWPPSEDTRTRAWPCPSYEGSTQRWRKAMAVKQPSQYRCCCFRSDLLVSRSKVALFQFSCSVYLSRVQTLAWGYTINTKDTLLSRSLLLPSSLLLSLTII